MFKTVTKTYTLLSVSFITWSIASYIEIILKQFNNPCYSKLNLIALLMQYWRKGGVKMYIMELSPKYTSRKSFYGKAKILIHDNGVIQLQSYDTIVCEIDNQNNFNMLWNGKSNTTTRHINEFKKQFSDLMEA